MASNARLLNLDLLRFVAVALVIGRHMAVWPKIPGWPVALQKVLMVWERGGWVGVDLFFVLSGFLVSGLLFGEFRSRGHISPGRFYIRRGLKIYPSFYVLLAVSAVLLPATGWPFSGRQLLAEMLFIQNYRLGLWSHTWSLAVEEHFYILLPLLLWAVLALNRHRKAPLRPVLYVAGGLAAGTLGLRIWHAQHVPYSHSESLFPTHLRLDSLMSGVALAYVYHFHRDRFDQVLGPWRKAFVVLGAACFAPAFIWPLGANAFVPTAGLTLFQVGGAMLVVSALLLPPVASPPLRLLAATGAYSYSIYLWHQAVIIHLEPFLERRVVGGLDYPPRYVFTFVVAIVFGVLMAKLVEMPVLGVRDRWFPSRSAAPAAAAVLAHLPAEGAGDGEADAGGPVRAAGLRS